MSDHEGGQAAYETELARLRGDRTNPLMDRVVEALRLLGATGPAHAEDILAAAGTHLSVRERAYVLDQLDPRLQPHAHTPGVAADPLQRHPCQVCGVELEWARHPDRDQYGWREVPS